MNQLGLVLYSGTIQFQAKRDLKLTRLSAIITPYLVKFMKHNKSNTTFLRQVVIIFSPIYLSEATYVISSCNLISELRELIPDVIIIPRIYRSPQGKTIYVAFINNVGCPNRFSFDGHPSTSKFLLFIRYYCNG